jgi:hypothetical protein
VFDRAETFARCVLGVFLDALSLNAVIATAVAEGQIVVTLAERKSIRGLAL